MITIQNSQNQTNKVASDVKSMLFKSCSFTQKTSQSSGNPYDVFEIELDYNPAQDYSKTIRVFPVKPMPENPDDKTKKAYDVKVRFMCGTLDQFAIAAVGKEKFEKKKAEFLAQPRTAHEYCTWIARAVNEGFKPGNEVELFQVFVPKEDRGYFNVKDGVVTRNGEVVKAMDVDFQGEKDGKIYRAIPESISHTGTFFRRAGDNTEFVESPRALAFRKLAEQKIEILNNPAPKQEETDDLPW